MEIGFTEAMDNQLRRTIRSRHACRYFDLFINHNW